MTNSGKVIPQIQGPPSVQRKTVVTGVIEAHHRPLPSPDEFAGYESVLPGSAERILRMAEAQAAHRQDMERLMISANIRAERRGQWFGLIATVLVLGAVCFSVYFKQTVAAALLGFGGISGLISAFITATKKAKSEQGTAQPK